MDERPATCVKCGQTLARPRKKFCSTRCRRQHWAHANPDKVRATRRLSVLRWIRNHVDVHRERSRLGMRKLRARRRAGAASNGRTPALANNTNR